jgi:diguanylate cyclase
MYLDGIAEARSFADAALGSMEQHGIPATPQNYALWYEYHGGYSDSLRRTIDVIVSNGVFDDRTLQDLYVNFLSSAKEERAVRETSLRVQETLHDVISLADSTLAETRAFGTTLSGAAATDFGKGIESLRELIGHLVAETQRMAGRSEYVGLRMRESAEKIEALERNLEKALRDATMDSLTGVANRKSFDGALRRMAGEAMNSGEDLSLLLVDIDHFKKVNDTWGHLAGDEILRHLARTLKESVRGQDHVARYGGEEFAVILPHTDQTAAASMGDSIRRALAREPVPAAGLEVDPPTVSIGVGCYDVGEPLAQWIGRTDSALYRAKKEGRNRVVSA